MLHSSDPDLYMSSCIVKLGVTLAGISSFSMHRPIVGRTSVGVRDAILQIVG